MSSRDMTPELRLKNFEDWIKKSYNKFGKKYYDQLEKGSISLINLKVFETRSERFSDIIKKMKLENKAEISFADLYYNSKEDMLIPCPVDNHGLVCMTPYMHTSSTTGCTKCSRKYNRTQEEFDEELKNTFGEDIKRLDPYKNQKTPMRMSCKKHGEFRNKKTGNDLLNGKQGCPICQLEESAENRRWKKDEWIKKSMEVYIDKKDDYSKIILETIGNTLWVHDLFCIVHQLHYCQRANDHHQGHRCSYCGKDTLSSLFRLIYKELIQRCKETHKEEKYEWDEKEPEDYKNGNSKISVICHNTYEDGKEHGIWHPSAHNHVNGSKCPRCKAVGYSKISIKWLSFLSSTLDTFIQHRENGVEYKISISGYKGDGYSLELNCIFEFHGCHVHGCISCYPNREELDLFDRYTHEENYQRTLRKKQFCLEQGYKYVEIWYCKWIKIRDEPDHLQKYIIELKNYLN